MNSHCCWIPLRRAAIVGLVALIFGNGPTALAQEPSSGASVSVKVLDFKSLGKAVTDHRGKLVVVDFWSTT